MLILAVAILFFDVYIELHGARLGTVEVLGMTLINWLGFGTAFAAGMLALAYKEHIPKHPALLAAALLSFIPAHYHPKLLLLLYPTSYVYILFWICFSSQPRLSAIGAKNDLSYGFYLYAFAIEQLLVYRLHWIKSPLTLFIVATALTAPCALFSWYCIEQPFKQMFSVSARKATLA